MLRTRLWPTIPVTAMLLMLSTILITGCGTEPAETPAATGTPSPTPTPTAAPTPTGTPEPSPHYSLTLGGGGDDRAADIQLTADGGCIIAGHTDSFGAGAYDAYLVKLDDQDQVTWAQTYGGKASDYANAVAQTGDGGFICAGLTKSLGSGKYDAYLIKTGPNGNLEWEKTYGGDGDDRAFSVRQTADGGFIVAGYTDSKGAGEDDVYLLKTDARGELVWERTFGGELDDRARYVTSAPKGGFLVVGYSVSFAEGKELSADIYILKIDGDGNEEWARTFGTTDTDYGYWLEYTPDGGYVISGYNVTYQVGARDFYIVKVDADGNDTLDKSIGGPLYERSGNILLSDDGGYVLAGHRETHGETDSDIWLVKTDANGEVVWDQTFGGSNKERAFRIRATADGGYIMAGYTDSFGAGGADIYIVKTDGDGNTSTAEPLPIPLAAQSPLPAVASPGSAPDSHAEPGYTCRGMCHHETGIKPNPPGHESYVFRNCGSCHAIPEVAAPVTDNATAGDLFVELVSVTEPVYPDSDITVAIKTVPGATCTIKVVLPKTGTVSNKPADRTREADSNGEVAWTWHLHRHTGAGDGTLTFTIEKDGNSLEQSFTFTVKPQ